MNTDEIKNDNIRLAELWEKTEKTFAAKSAQKHIPLGGTFELTPRCNLRCKMCYIRMDKPQMDQIGREITAKEWIALAKEAVEAGTLNLLITGGEPLIRDDFEEIYTAISEMGFVVSLNTNAALMNTEYLKLFRKYPPTATNVTLYGASPKTYEKICGNPDGFYKTIRGIEMLSQVSTVLEVRTTYIKDNMNELEELRRIANQYTKRFAINVTVNKPIRGAKSDVEKCRLYPAEMFDIVDANLDYYKNLNKGSEDALERNMETDFHKDIDYGFDLPPKILTCLAAKSMYWITWDGKMLPCGSFSSPYTLPFEEGFKAAWDRLPHLFENIDLPKECKKCEYVNSCSNCPAMLQMETGSLDKISPYICSLTKEKIRRYGGK